MKKVAVSIHATDDFDPKLIKSLKGFDFIHVDIMDGKFVKTNNKNLNVLKILKDQHNKPIIAHLMVINPFEYIEEIIDFVDYFVFHYEAEGDINEINNEVKRKKRKIGIAINPETDLDKIFPFLNVIDLVLIMCVHPGWSGQKFILDMIEKVNSLNAYKIENELNFLIDVDGGINPENSKLINSDILSSASAILNANDPNHVIHTMKYSDKDEK
jgi:ribulose-phosphate 3-epimerase